MFLSSVLVELMFLNLKNTSPNSANAQISMKFSSRCMVCISRENVEAGQEVYEYYMFFLPLPQIYFSGL